MTAPVNVFQNLIDWFNRHIRGIEVITSEPDGENYEAGNPDHHQSSYAKEWEKDSTEN